MITHILVKYFKLLHVVSLSCSFCLLLGVHGALTALGVLRPTFLEAPVPDSSLWGLVAPSPKRRASNV